MNTLAMAAVYGTVTTVMLALSRVIPAVFGSFVVRKSLINISALSLAALAISLIISALELKNTIDVILFWVWLSLFLYHFGLGVLLRLYVRATRFKDYGTLRNLRAMPPVPAIRASWRWTTGDRETYETSPLSLSEQAKREQMLDELLDIKIVDRPTLLLTGSNPTELRRFALRIATALMKPGYEHDANFVCCTTSPESVWSMFKSQVSADELGDLKNRFVIIDAYTKPFGFAMKF